LWWEAKILATFANFAFPIHPAHAHSASPAFATQSRIWVWIHRFSILFQAHQCGVGRVVFLVGWVLLVGENGNTFGHFEAWKSFLGFSDEFDVVSALLFCR
jgi:hypothetical protein